MFPLQDLDLHCNRHPSKRILYIKQSRKGTNHLVCEFCLKQEPIKPFNLRNFSTFLAEAVFPDARKLKQRKEEHSEHTRELIQHIEDTIESIRRDFETQLALAREKLIADCLKFEKDQEKYYSNFEKVIEFMSNIQREKNENKLKILNEFLDSYMNKAFSNELLNMNQNKITLPERALQKFSSSLHQSIQTFERTYLKYFEFSIHELNLQGTVKTGPNKRLSLRGIDYIKDQNLYVVVDEGGYLSFYDLDTNKQLLNTQIHSEWITCVKYIPERKILISGSFDRKIKVFKILPGPQLKQVAWLSKHTNYIWNTLPILPMNLLVSSGDDGDIKLWNLKNFRLVGHIKTNSHKKIRAEVTFIPHRKLLAAAFCEGKISLFDIRSKREVFTTSCQAYSEAWILSLTLVESLNSLFIGTKTGVIECWDINETELTYSKMYYIPGDIPRKIVPMNNNQMLLVLSLTKDIMVLDLELGELDSVALENADSCINFVVCPEKRKLLVCDYEGQVFSLQY